MVAVYAALKACEKLRVEPYRLENGRAPRGGEERDAAGLGCAAKAPQLRLARDSIPSPRVELGPAPHFAFIFASFFAEVTFFAFFFLPRPRPPTLPPLSLVYGDSQPMTRP